MSKIDSLGETIDYTNARIEHLKMIQNVIQRMSTSSTVIKRYAVVVALAVSGSANLVGKPDLLVVGGMAMALFAFVDAEYLRTEKAFRTLFDEVRAEPSDQAPDFRMDATKTEQSFCAALVSWSVGAVYFGLVALILIGLL
ncbi:hypothetical protein [Spiribacter roseus]|uniref:hypothetical protein n=1 Tax=Spiribacter roseus TaxID=1855875 RepID=UPI001330406E|nr:hypothetical protein [Spiribacter roseus]